jgi:phospholipid/cholesterol/gamma-HCH transport system ATP-binding protein
VERRRDRRAHGRAHGGGHSHGVAQLAHHLAHGRHPVEEPLDLAPRLQPGDQRVDPPGGGGRRAQRLVEACARVLERPLGRAQRGPQLDQDRDGGAQQDGPGRPRFGVMFQSGALLGSLTVGENVALPLQAWSGLPLDAIGAIVAAKLRLVGLQRAEDQLPGELSGGMRKRAGIARAMALEPDLLFLDEPSAGLDPVSAAELDELILELNGRLGLTFVVVTHDLESIFKVGQRCIMLDRESQSIIARGDPRVLRDTSADPRVHAFFNRTRRVVTS